MVAARECRIVISTVSECERLLCMRIICLSVRIGIVQPFTLFWSLLYLDVYGKVCLSPSFCSE
jgi:hypothetical protein